MLYQTQNFPYLYYYSLSHARSQLVDPILRTLAYTAVFNYPLNGNEIYRYFIVGRSCYQRPSETVQDKLSPVDARQIYLTLFGLVESGLVCERDGYYFLPGMNSSVKQRQRRERIAKRKFILARKFAKLAKLIPTIELIGVSGALAMQNAHEEDDIDLFIVAQSGTVWITRFLTVLLAELLRVRRRPATTPCDLLCKTPGVVRDKICLNMFVDEAHLSIPPEERDLFSAHEVIQLVPIYDRDDTYLHFIDSNLWVREYLPNATDKLKTQYSILKSTRNILKVNKTRITNYELRITNFVEKTFKRAQLLYMKNKVTTEIIKDGYLRFHPSDARKFVLRRYWQILRNSVMRN